MTRHIDPYPAPENRSEELAYRSSWVFAIALLSLLALAALYGCAAQTTATVNRDITTVIAGAGAAANQAEQAYQNKTIAQTPGARNVINNLGAAYEQARTAYLAVLDAEKIYRAAEDAQLLSCRPSLTAASTGSASNCQATTQSVTAAQIKLQAAESDLNAKVASLAAQTKAVQSLK